MDIDALRKDTPGTAHRVHLNNAGAGLLSRQTLEAMTAHLELEAAIGGYEAAGRQRDMIDATYADIARLVGGRAAEIALFDNSTHERNWHDYSLTFNHCHRFLSVRAEY
ncbi:aminotransferase, partial [Streptomyces sp. NPDC058272]